MMWIKWRVGWKNPIDYNDLQKRGSLLWSGWRETRTGSSTTPFPKLHTIISVSYKPLFPKTTPPFL